MQRFIQAVLLAAMIAGCGLQGVVQDESSMLVAQYATIKVIDGDIDKRDRVIEIATEVREFASNESSLSVDALMIAIRAQIDFRSLDPADTLLVNTLLQRLRDELADHLGAGALPEDVQLAATTVADWVIEAAQLI